MRTSYLRHCSCFIFTAATTVIHVRTFPWPRLWHIITYRDKFRHVRECMCMFIAPKLILSMNVFALRNLIEPDYTLKVYFHIRDQIESQAVVCRLLIGKDSLLSLYPDCHSPLEYFPSYFGFLDLFRSAIHFLQTRTSQGCYIYIIWP